MGEGFEMGLAAGTAVAKGVADWRAIQLDRQNRKEFDGAMALAAQRRGMIASAGQMQATAQLQEMKTQIQRSPGAQQVARPTGNVGEDGSPETEQVIRTGEGDIPIGQMLMLKAQQQQSETQRALAEVDLIMELQSRYPNNPYVKQWAASTYAGIQQKQQIRSKQVEAQRLQLDTLAAGLAREQFEQEKRKYNEQPERDERKAATENALNMQRDQARIQEEQAKDIAVEGVKAQNKPEKPATEFVKKLQQMAPRAQEALDTLDSLDVDRTSIEQGAQSLLPNALRSGTRQQFDQAKLQFVNSVLRAESGATVTENEINKALQQYFPTVGESQEVVAQKRRARETAVQNLFKAAELEPPARKARDNPTPRSPDEVRAAFKAGQLTREQAREMLRTMGR